MSSSSTNPRRSTTRPFERGGDGTGDPQPTPARAIVHLDVDAFLASVEQAVHPELAGLPVVVGGLPSERNLVMSCSYEARAFGVRPGLSLRAAARLCPQALFRRGDSQAANRLREAVTRILLAYTPCVEVASIDDFFVDLTGAAHLHGTARTAAESMRARIRGETRLPVTIGIGTSKTLARLAGKLAKPGGIAEILPGGERAFLAHLPIEHLPGVGHAIGERLERFAIRTAGELARVSREVLYATFGRPGLVVHDRARAIDPDPVEATHVEGPDGTLIARLPRSIHRDSTFEPEEGRREIVEAMLAYLVERAAHRLRSLGGAAATLEVRLRYVDTRPPAESWREPRGEGSTFASRALPLAEPTDSTELLCDHALALLAALPRRRALVKTVGLTLSNLAHRSAWQHRLFSVPGDERYAERAPCSSRADRARRLDRAVDGLRERFGFGRILRGKSIALTGAIPWTPQGFRLRTPSLNQ